MVQHDLHHVVRKGSIQSQLDVGHRQAVLIALLADLAPPDFRGHVSRRAGAAGRSRLLTLVKSRQPEVCHLGVFVENENVVRLDIPMDDVLGM